jgi:hypothetical protein
MTATAYKLDRRHIKAESLGLHNCFELVTNNRKMWWDLLRKGIQIQALGYWCLGGHLQPNLCCSVCKTQCLCVECSSDMEREWFYLIRQIFWGCEMFLTLYQMNKQLITNWNHINSIYFMDSTKTHPAVPEQNSKLNIYVYVQYTVTI